MRRCLSSLTGLVALLSLIPPQAMPPKEESTSSSAQAAGSNQGADLGAPPAADPLEDDIDFYSSELEKAVALRESATATREERAEAEEREKGYGDLLIETLKKQNLQREAKAKMHDSEQVQGRSLCAVIWSWYVVALRSRLPLLLYYILQGASVPRSVSNAKRARTTALAGTIRKSPSDEAAADILGLDLQELERLRGIERQLSERLRTVEQQLYASSQQLYASSERNRLLYVKCVRVTEERNEVLGASCALFAGGYVELALNLLRREHVLQAGVCSGINSKTTATDMMAHWHKCPLVKLQMPLEDEAGEMKEREVVIVTSATSQLPNGEPRTVVADEREVVKALPALYGELCRMLHHPTTDHRGVMRIQELSSAPLTLALVTFLRHYAVRYHLCVLPP